MRLSRLALPALAASVALAALTTPAWAVFGGAYLSASDAVFSSATSGTMTIEYVCGDDADPSTTTSTFPVYLSQADVQTATEGAHATGWATAVCDNQRNSAVVPLTLDTDSMPLVAGAAALRVYSPGEPDGSNGSTNVVLAFDPTPTPTPTPTPPPAPAPKASVSLKTNASPETVTKGKKITVKGSVRRNGKKISVKTALEFRSDGVEDYSKVKSVTSTKAGNLSTKVTAGKSGAFRYVYAGNTTTQAATSTGDHIVVKLPAPSKPKPKAYKNCTALTKVYPHGVGKSGAHDKGGDVTNFTRDTKTYKKNKKSDRDKDGIACER